MLKRLFTSFQIRIHSASSNTLLLKSLLVWYHVQAQEGVMGADPQAYTVLPAQSRRMPEAMWVRETDLCSTPTYNGHQGRTVAMCSKIISLQQAAYSGWPVGATVEEWLDPEAFQHQSCRGSQGLYSSDLLLYTGRKKHKTQTLQIFLTTLQLRCSIRNVKTMVFFEYEETQITVYR